MVLAMTYSYRNLRIFEYNRERAVKYAHEWALKRNPEYYNFEDIGGDCTNFASQVIYAGSAVMNFTPLFGWYYFSPSKRSPSWTGVNFLYNFLINNKGPGPFAEIVDIKGVKPGDIVQLSFDDIGIFNHSLVIVDTGNEPGLENILVATHSDDHDNYPLYNYDWKEIRFIHILGVKKA